MRRCAVRREARTLPPLRPPRRPSATAAGFFPLRGDVGCPVVAATIQAAAWLGSWGVLLRCLGIYLGGSGIRSSNGFAFLSGRRLKSIGARFLNSTHLAGFCRRFHAKTAPVHLSILKSSPPGVLISYLGNTRYSTATKTIAEIIRTVLLERFGMALRYHARKKNQGSRFSNLPTTPALCQPAL